MGRKALVRKPGSLPGADREKHGRKQQNNKDDISDTWDDESHYCQM